MSNGDQTAYDPVATIMAAQGTKMRAIGFILTLVGVFLPALTSSVMGVTESASVAQFAWWAAFVPTAAALAMIAPGIRPLRPYSRLIDIATAILGLIAAGYAIFVVADSMGKANAILAELGDLGDSVGASIAPGFGLFIYIAGVAVLIAQAVRVFLAH